VYDHLVGDLDLARLHPEVTSTLEALRASGDSIVGQTARANDELAVFLLEAWAGSDQSSSQQHPSEVLAKPLRTRAKVGPMYDWPFGSYRFVGQAVADTIERGFHLDPLPPGATGYVNHGRVADGLRKQFAQSLFAVAGATGYEADRVRDGMMKSFDEYVLTDNSGTQMWVLAHVVVPVFAAVGSAPTYGLVDDFVDPEVCQGALFEPWVFQTRAQLVSLLTPFLTSQLMLEDHKAIERNGCEIIGAAMYNLWD